MLSVCTKSIFYHIFLWNAKARMYKLPVLQRIEPLFFNQILPWIGNHIDHKHLFLISNRREIRKYVWVHRANERCKWMIIEFRRSTQLAAANARVFRMFRMWFILVTACATSSFTLCCFILPLFSSPSLYPHFWDDDGDGDQMIIIDVVVIVKVVLIV